MPLVQHAAGGGLGTARRIVAITHFIHCSTALSPVNPALRRGSRSQKSWHGNCEYYRNSKKTSPH